MIDARKHTLDSVKKLTDYSDFNLYKMDICYDYSIDKIIVSPHHYAVGIFHCKGTAPKIWHFKIDGIIGQNLLHNCTESRLIIKNPSVNDFINACVLFAKGRLQVCCVCGT